MSAVALLLARASSSRGLLRDALDPRALLAYLGVMLVLAFTIQHPLQIAALSVAAWLVVVGVLDPAEYRAYLAYGSVAVAGVVVLNPLVSRAGVSSIWVSPALPLVGSVPISAEAIVYGVAMALRLACVVGLFALYSTLVDPDAVYRLIAPYSLGSALVIALSIRLFPTSVRDAANISDAMRARGVALDAGGLLARARARAPVVESLTTTSLDRAMNLAEALESRGYGRPGRTRLPLPSLAPRDRVVLVIVLALATAGAALAVASGSFTYYPRLDDPAVTADLIGAVVLGLLGSTPLLSEWGWAAWHLSRSRT